MSKVEQKVARRIKGFMGIAQAARDNADRLHMRVQALEAEASAIREANAALRAALATFTERLDGRIDMAVAAIRGLDTRITTAETLFIAKAAPIPGFAAEPPEAPAAT